MSILFVIPTQETKIEDTFFHKHILKNYPTLANRRIPKVQEDKDIRFRYFLNNKESISKIYNNILRSVNDKPYMHSDYIVFCHDDVALNPFHVAEVLDGYYETDKVVIGVAGTSNITISPERPSLWHIMSQQGCLHGNVAHYVNDKGDYAYTSFGVLNKDCVLVDGVFMAVHTQNWSNNPVYFNEENPCKFHFYDLAFSLDNCIAKNKVHVADIPIIHNSPGLRSYTTDWTNGHNWFLKTYEKYQGSNITV